MATGPYDGLYWETHFPLGLQNLLQNIAKQNPKDPNVPDIWNPPSAREWLSLPRGANSYTVKHNVFTFSDTFDYFDANGNRTTVGNQNKTPDFGDDLNYSQLGYPAQVARLLNPNLFNWVPVAYNSSAFPLITGVTDAVTRAVTLIKGTPGKIFLVGAGIGSVITGLLYNEFRSGQLESRRADLLGIFNFGSPVREEGHTVPGGIATPGHGMAPSGERVASTEELVWEFVHPDDIVTTQINNQAGAWSAAIYEQLLQHVTSPDSVVSQINSAVIEPAGRPTQLVTLFSQIIRQLLSNAGAHNDYQNCFPFANSNVNAIDGAAAAIVEISTQNPPETVNRPVTEVLSVNYRMPVSISEISFEVLRSSVSVEVWYQDRYNKWRQMVDDDSVPITIKLGTTDSVSWYRYHTQTYPIVAKAIQYRLTRIPNALVGDTPYCVGIRNTLVRRNVYNRQAGLQNMEDEQDALGNVITKTIKDWDAAKAIDDNPTTFWRSAAQPDPDAVVAFYLDLRDVDGKAQTVDKVYIDPVYTGQIMNLYYSSDETIISRKLNPVSMQPNNPDAHFEWQAGAGLKDTTTSDSQTSLYETNFNVGPMVSQDCWIGIQWTPQFDAFSQKVNSYSFNASARTITLTGLSSVVLANIQSVFDATTGNLIYSKSRDLLNSSLSGKTLTVPGIPAACRNTDTLEIYYGTSGPAPTELVLFEIDPNNTSGSQFWPRVYYDVGSASIKLELLNAVGGTPMIYSAPVAPLFTSGTTLNIVVGWTYSGAEPKIHIVVRSNRRAFSDYEVTDGDFPRKITFDGRVRFSQWRGIFGAHILKHESYSFSSDQFLANPISYCGPEPILVGGRAIPSSSLDNALLAADWTTQRFVSGGTHESIYADKEWTPIWANYITEKGFLYLPRATSMKYLKLEFTQLTAEPYPVYDVGIKVNYQIYPVTVTATQPIKKPDGLLGVISNVINAIGSINWLNPSTIGKAINQIFGKTVEPIQTTLQIGPGYTSNALPNTTQTAITDTVRTEANSPWVYRRTPISPLGLVKNFLGALFGQNQNQTKSLIPSIQKGLIEAETLIGAPVSSTPSPVPIQGKDWYVFPGQTLRMPAAIIEGITKSQVVTGKKSDKSIRTRFTTTAVHKYETKEVTLDAAIGYFAGLREVQPYVASYIDYEDPPEFRYDSYDPALGWSLVSINRLNAGPITAKSNPYAITNSGFDLSIDHWTPTGTWDWDNSEGHAVKDTWQPGIPLLYGSAHTVAQAQNKSLLSETVPVTAGDQIKFTAWIVYKDAASTNGGRIFVDAVGLNNNTVIWSAINLGTGMKIDNPSGSSVPVYGVKAIKLTGTCTIPVNVNNLQLRLNVNDKVTAGDFWFDDVHMEPVEGVVGSAYNIITTKSTFSKVRCRFSNSGLRKSDSMWAQADDKDANISRTALAYYVDTIPSIIPSGNWGDTFGAWGNKTSGLPILDGVKWGTPFATVAIQVDPNMIFDKKRVLHFYRAAKRGSVETGEAGIIVRQETNFVPNGLFRICARWYKPKKTDNVVKLRLRRISGDTSGGIYPYGYVYQETVNSVEAGYWHTHQTKWAAIPDSDDQTYTLEIVLSGDAEDDIYLNDLWVEISQVRYHVKLGGGINHDVTALAYSDNCSVSSTTPVTQMELSTTVYGDRSFAYGATFTPLYLK
jgi:hypothetical protein